MKSRITLFVPTAIALAVAGCSGLMPDTKKIEYKSASKIGTLEVPPDLSQITRDDRYTVPDVAGKGTATASAYAADRQGNRQEATSSKVLPTIEKVRVERSGNQRWLVVDAPADQIWDTIKDFWQELGFIVKVEIPEAGVIETDWAENRAKIPNDLIRNTLGRLLDSLYSTGERDKFRTRLEPGRERGTTEIYISHRGMEEVYSSEMKDQTRWQPRQADSELEAEMLRRLMVRFGTEEKRAEATIAAARVEPRAKLSRTADSSGTVEVQESFDRAWRRVGLALDRIGFTVEDRDRAKGIYFVRYIDPEVDNKVESKGWLSRLAFWKGSDDKPVDSKIQYRIYVKEGSDVSTVQVLTREGGVEKSETAVKILNLLYEQLK